MAFPKWLTWELVQRALQKKSHSKIKVSSFAMGLFDEEAGNYTSTLHWLIANTSEGEKIMVAKTLPESKHATKLEDDGELFRREALMYGAVIPDFYAMLRGRKDDNGEPLLPSPFAPSHIYNGKHPQEYIFLQDLRKEGFRVAGRHEGLDLEHSVLALRTLGVFHGVSAAYLRYDSLPIQKLGNPYVLLKDYFQRTAKQYFLCVADKCNEWYTYDIFSYVIKNLADSVSLELANCHSHGRKGFLVICHGDFQLNNMLFKYEGKTVKEVRFVDFQMSHVTSPAADLLYFICTSIQFEVYRVHRLKLLREYYVSLKKTLEAFRLPSPDLEFLGKILQANRMIGVHATIAVAPILKGRIPIATLRLLKQEDYQDCRFLDCDNVADWLKILLVEFARWKWIDVPGYETMSTKCIYSFE